jgi:hypothetical protein
MKTISGILYTALAGYVLTAAPLLAADQTATTSLGKTVILKDNNTWRYATPEEAKQIATLPTIAISPVRPDASTAEKPKIATGSLINFVVKSDTADFRLTHWGETLAQVKAVEKSQLEYERKDSLVYKALLFELNCRIIYVFTAGALTSGSFVIEQPHVDPARFLVDYENLKQFLQPTYGKFISEENMWKNEMYKNQPESFGFAISIGFLEKKTIWQDKRSRVELFITGQNHQITTRIDYYKKK